MARVTGFFHAGITVRDMDVALAFYRDGLGLEEQFDRLLEADYLRDVLALDFSAIRAVYLAIPGGGIVELLEYQGIERLSARSRPNDYGAGHLCLYVDDVAEMTERLRARGGTSRSESVVAITSGPNEGATSIYMLDPDGYAVELFERRKDS
ncbi:MAG: VOC family protein [Salinibacterium sp.]|nr:VOC family protein [Salinibacterium sp.]